MITLKATHKRLARLRCLQECLNCLKTNSAFPDSLCYVPNQLEYRVTENTQMTIFSEPCRLEKKESGPVVPLEVSSCRRLIICTPDIRVITSGDELYNSEGQWTKLKKLYNIKSGKDVETFTGDSWFLIYSTTKSIESPHLALCDTDHTIWTALIQSQPKIINNWEQVVEHKYSLQIPGLSYKVLPQDDDTVKALKYPAQTWTADHDADLGQFLHSHMDKEHEHLGSVKSCVDNIQVSSFSEEDEGPDKLTDNDPDTYWESDGSQGQHWVKLTMKQGKIIKKLIVTIDGEDDNYMPNTIVVMGGSCDYTKKKLNEVNISSSFCWKQDVTILEEQTEFFPVIEIKLTECKDEGIDCRLHGIKIKLTDERDMGLNRDLFIPENLVRYPKLEPIDPKVLYNRALALFRFVSLLDSVLAYIVPAWEYSIGSYNSLDIARQLLPLSKKRMSLIETFMRESETARPNRVPKLYINRQLAAEHKVDPSIDPECKNSVFIQIYEGLKPKDQTQTALDYRWSTRFEQWWECKFMTEGIIDQGGGFRESISDLADELCPSDADAQVPLPFFIRTPNANSADANVNKDMFIPNPACKDSYKYEWIGKLMGACLRGKENLVLSLPPIIWKRLTGESVTWARDFATVDEAQVKMLENMEQGMDEETFDVYFGGCRTWTTTLSSGSVVNLKDDGDDVIVTYEERAEYVQLVQKARMEECDFQVDAIKRGLLAVVPQAVLDLYTWQELERGVCGNPEITLEDIKKTTYCYELEDSDTRVKYFWEAMKNFSNEDRSRFLRFVTGRRRLPAPIYLCATISSSQKNDGLPESSTCANTLYLPNYSSAKLCEEKLRYAAYNCIAIDTDTSPWDEY